MSGTPIHSSTLTGQYATITMRAAVPAFSPASLGPLAAVVRSRDNANRDLV